MVHSVPLSAREARCKRLTKRLGERSNDEWIAALRGEGAAGRVALDELRAYLHRTLRKVLRKQRHLDDHDFADLTQEVFLRLVEYLPTFRGDSAFATWAAAVATRVAFTELRKRSARDRGQRAFERIREGALASPTEDVVSKQQLLRELAQAIESELTDRQKIAILAELRGVPTVELARQLDTNQNALYKLIHDGRKKLRHALIAAGFTPAVIHESVEGAYEQ